jgi:hypothetical protein
LATLTNSTAIGSNAQVTTSNSMVLGSINGVNGATSSTNVGIGTTAPSHVLHVLETGNDGAVSGLYVNESNAGQAVTIEEAGGGQALYIIESGGGNGILITANDAGGAMNSTAQGAVTAAVVGHDFYDIRTSSTAAISKIGARISSTGTWDGAGSTNTGLSVSVSGGTTNYAALFNGGNVGIGTSSPPQTLSVHGTIGISEVGGSGQRLQISSTGTGAVFFQNDNSPIIFQTQSGTAEKMRITDNGRVGINNTNPDYPLDIAGTTVNGPNQNYRWFTQNNANNSTITSSTITPNQTNGTNHGRISLRAAGSIWASGGGFYASSDARAKNNIETKNAANSLSLINKLHVVKYNWIDATKSNHEYEDGFIAQEVEKIIPQAVNKATDFLPNVYALADNYSISNEALHISMSKEYDLQKGDLVKFHTEDGKEHRLNVIDAKGTQYSFALTEEAKSINGKLFVYGKEVEDFNTVDYDRIFTIGISAIQELSKKVDALEKENASLKSENTAMMKSLKAQIDIINERLSIKTEK